MLLTLVLTLVHTLGATAVIPDRDRDGRPHLRSESVAVQLADTGEVVLDKRGGVARPIASVTKLLSGLVLASMDADEERVVRIEEGDKDLLKHSRSRVYVGLAAPWGQLVEAAIGASDNRAMNAVVRAVLPRAKFVEKMNSTARELGMSSSHFVEPTGVDPNNTSTARDLLLLVNAAAGNERVCAWSRTLVVDLGDDSRRVSLRNPDRLAHLPSWNVVVGKTGYTVEAGRTFVIRATIAERPVNMVFLGSREMASVFGDAGRVRRWLAPQLEGQVRARTILARVSRDGLTRPR